VATSKPHRARKVALSAFSVRATKLTLSGAGDLEATSFANALISKNKEESEHF
jgi:hypothetical protein